MVVGGVFVVLMLEEHLFLLIIISKQFFEQFPEIVHHFLNEEDKKGLNKPLLLLPPLPLPSPQ